MNIIKINMIIWLASYPKSGNTWLRTILIQILKEKILDQDNLLSEIKSLISYPQKKHFFELSEILDNYEIFNNYLTKSESETFRIREEIIKNWLTSQQKINISNETKIFKTHNLACKLKCQNGKDYAFTDIENTLGVIYIIRDPRNIITSLKHHYSMNSYEDALRFMSNKSLWLEDNNKVPEFLSSWDMHYESWSRFPKNFLLIKYEDLLSNTYDQIEKIVKFMRKFLDFDIKNISIDKIIHNSSFENLKKNEDERGFDESVTDRKTNKKIKFFNLGPNNDWKKLLNKKTANEIEETFAKTMKKVGYLN